MAKAFNIPWSITSNAKYNSRVPVCCYLSKGKQLFICVEAIIHKFPLYVNNKEFNCKYNLKRDCRCNALYMCFCISTHKKRWLKDTILYSQVSLKLKPLGVFCWRKGIAFNISYSELIKFANSIHYIIIILLCIVTKFITYKLFYRYMRNNNSQPATISNNYLMKIIRIHYILRPP